MTWQKNDLKAHDGEFLITVSGSTLRAHISCSHQVLILRLSAKPPPFCNRLLVSITWNEYRPETIFIAYQESQNDLFLPYIAFL